LLPSAATADHVSVIDVVVAAALAVVHDRALSQPRTIWVTPVAELSTSSQASILGTRCTPVESEGANRRPTVTVFVPAAPAPAELVAVTENVYEAPVVRPLTVQESAPVVAHVLPAVVPVIEVTL
jgi:hypothetical protein